MAIGTVWVVEAWADGVWADGVWASTAGGGGSPAAGATWGHALMRSRQLVRAPDISGIPLLVEPGQTKDDT